MNTKRVLLVGAMLWAVAFTSFMILSMIPEMAESENLQALIVGIVLVPATTFGAALYFKRSKPLNGMFVGATMVTVALFLDAIITVPFVMIPMGVGYGGFYSNPVLWALVLENILIVYIYWATRIKHLTPQI